MTDVEISPQIGQVLVQFEDHFIPESLASIFSVPEDTPEEYVAMYRHMTNQMRAEAQGMPMNTIQTLLIERIAFNYIVIRMKEAGVQPRFTTSNGQKDFNSFWLSMTAEFNKLLASGQDKLKDQLFTQIQEVLQASMKEAIDDEPTRIKFEKSLSAGLKAIDL